MHPMFAGPQSNSPDDSPLLEWVQEHNYRFGFFFLMSRLSWQAADDAALGCRDAGTVQPSSKIPPISRVVNIANTAAMSLLAR